VDTLTQSEFQDLSESDAIKIVRHVPLRQLKTIVSAYRSVGAQVVSRPELGKKNEYVVTAQFN
jgi:hypothetical protein